MEFSNEDYALRAFERLQGFEIKGGPILHVVRMFFFAKFPPVHPSPSG